MNLNEIHKIAVLGSGNMGPGIALQFALAGYPVVVWGLDERRRAKARSNFLKNLGDLLREGILDQEGADEIRRRTGFTTDLTEATKKVSFLVEAIPEVLELKQELFAQLEKSCSPDSIIASTTSTLLPSPLSEKMKHRERFLVAHFWNPAYLAPLVEVCGSPHTGQQVIDTTMDLLAKIGNEPVLMRREILGFIGNRIMHAMNREALALIGEGVCDAADIDRVVHASFGPRFAHLGPMEYLDATGLDLIRNIQGYLYGDLDTTPGVLPLIDELVKRGDLGKKSGRGLFDWSAREDRIRENRDKEFIRRLREVREQDRDQAWEQDREQEDHE